MAQDGASCWDINDCYEEDSTYVVTVEPGEVVGLE
jgi:hypothetical protein